jgi:hypothetical protein
MTREVTDEQLTQRAKLATPVLEAIAFAEGHVARLRAEMREQASVLPGMAAALAVTIACEQEILAKRYKRLAEVFRSGR